MLYEVEIPGELPTLLDHARARTAHRAYELAMRTIRMVKDYLEGAPAFSGHVHVGFFWVRQNPGVAADDVVYSKSCIIDALRRQGVIGEKCLCFSTDLGFRMNARDPRTVVYIADTEEELIAAARDRGVAYA